MVMRGLSRGLHGTRRNGRMHVPAAPSRPAHEAREERHGEHDRQGAEENAAEDAHAKKHIGPQRIGPPC
jgi:hypothetical protein